nr:hypothetical protein [Tanacetum cinerariifolium]
AHARPDRVGHAHRDAAHHQRQHPERHGVTDDHQQQRQRRAQAFNGFHGNGGDDFSADGDGEQVVGRHHEHSSSMTADSRACARQSGGSGRAFPQRRSATGQRRSGGCRAQAVGAARRPRSAFSSRTNARSARTAGAGQRGDGHGVCGQSPAGQRTADQPSTT